MDVKKNVREYYGKTLKTSIDLQTTACTMPTTKMRKHVRDAISLIHGDILKKYYGCGLVIPECLEGLSILDLGSGSGRDCYAVAKLVGESGFVTGVDMTDEQLETADKYIDYHRELFGFKSSNVKFVKGCIEDLAAAGIQDTSMDVIISNCVVNLCEDKKAVLKEAFRVLKYGGELYFSDMYADRIVTEDMKNNETLWGEGLSGALYWKELFTLAKEIGFEMPRIASARVVEVTRPELKKLVGDTRYISIKCRLFKLSANVCREPAEVMYCGGITGYDDEFQFDHNTKFPKHVPVSVDGDLAAIIHGSRFKGMFHLSQYGKDTLQALPQPQEDNDPFAIALVCKNSCNKRS